MHFCYGRKIHEFKRNAETTYCRFWAELSDLCADSALFTAFGDGGVFWKSKPYQACELAGEDLYLYHAGNSAYASAPDLVFRAFLSVEDEYRRL